MATKKAFEVEVPASVATGGTEDISTIANAHLVVSTAAFVATIKLQVSVDATVWHDYVAALAPGDAIPIPEPWRYLRCDTTAYTSGTPAADVVGEY